IAASPQLFPPSSERRTAIRDKRHIDLERYGDSGPVVAHKSVPSVSVVIGPERGERKPVSSVKRCGLSFAEITAASTFRDSNANLPPAAKAAMPPETAKNSRLFNLSRKFIR